MTKQHASLRGSLLRSLLLPGVAAALLGLLIVYSLVKEEYDELQDMALSGKAHLMLELFEVSRRLDPSFGAVDLSALLAFEKTSNAPEDRTSYRFVDAEGRLIAQSPGADLILGDLGGENGLFTAQGQRVAVVTASGDPQTTLLVATPMTERNETLTDVLLSVGLGFVLIGLLFTITALRAVRRSVAVIRHLSQDIASKNENDLSPIDRTNSFAEIEPAIETLDMLMSRLDAALAGERAFATNAAHELRTPLAICLAHVQRLRRKLTDPEQSQSVAEIETGLKRLVRLTERLLQLSRAQSGLGSIPVVADVTPVIRLLLKELRDREPAQDRLVITQPTGIWSSHADPDAIGIMLGNLFDNALKYSEGPVPVRVDAHQTGVVVITNDCGLLSPAELEAAKRRYVRKTAASDGFGLGLSIVQSLCDQSGCTLTIFSPEPGKDRGFQAVLRLPHSH